MKETMNPISAVAAAALGVLSAYMVQLVIPLIVLVAAMLVDYGTGMAKAWSAGELCSRTGIKGILKKVGYLVIVLVAMGADYLLRRAGLSRCVVQDDPRGGGPLRQRAVPLVVHLVNFHRSRPPCPPPPSLRGSR